MSCEHRLLMRRRLELYHDLLTEQLRPRVEAAAAATAEAITEFTTDSRPESDIEKNIDEDTDDTDDTDDSDEDLCEWEHTENKSSEESCARVAQWRCGIERNSVWEDDTPDYGGNDEKGSVRGELEQRDDGEAASSTEVSQTEHSGSGIAADMGVQGSAAPQKTLTTALPSNPTAETEKQGLADDENGTFSGSDTTKREAYIAVLLDQTASTTVSLQNDSLDDLTTPPTSPCREASVTTSPVSMSQTSLRHSNLNLSIPRNSMISGSPLHPKPPPPWIFLPSHYPPTPPPDTTSSSSSYLQPHFTVTPAELKFFNRHIEEVAYMIRGIDYQFQMQEYRQEIRRQDRRRKRRAEVEEQLGLIEWGNGVPSEWNNVGGMGEAEVMEESAGETEHHNWDTSGEWTSGGLEAEQSAGTNGEDADDPSSSELVEIREGSGTRGHEDNLDSVWPDDIGDGETIKEEWNFSWSSKLTELKEKIQLHQPIKPSPLRKGYTPDDMVWEEAVEEAEYLSFYGHQFKKDKRGRRYWRL